MDTLISTFMKLPACPVWLHERHVCSAIAVPQGQMFGQYHALSCIVGVIQNGYGGNKKNGSNPYYCVDRKYAHCNFSEHNNTHGIYFQEYGSTELFKGGTSADRGSLRKPRWFCLGGRPVCNLQIQTAIVAEAMGDDSIEMDDTTRSRRKAGFMSFFFEDTIDGGYSSIDITQIARNNYQLLPSIFSKSATAITDARSERIERRLFVSAELADFENILRLMLVSKVKNGKVLVSGESWVLQKTKRVMKQPVNTVRSLTPPPPQSSQRQQQQPPPRKSKNRPRQYDDSDGFEGLPSFFQKSNLCECVYYS